MKEPIKWMKKQATDLEKILVNHIFSKGERLEYIRTLQIQQFKKNQTIQLVNGEKAHRNIRLKKINRYQVNPSEGIYHSSPLGKCKLKVQ